MKTTTLSRAALPVAAKDAAATAPSTIIAGLKTDVDRDEVEVEAVMRDDRRVELQLDPGTGGFPNETADD